MDSKTHWKQNFDYRFTGAYELKPGEEVTLTIKKLGHEQLKNQQGQEETCFVAYFDGKHKPLVLNKTNCKTIEKLYGPYQEDWIGKNITIHSASVKAFGETVDAIRVRQIKPKRVTPATEEQLTQIAELLEAKPDAPRADNIRNGYKQYDSATAQKAITWLTGQ